MSIQFKYATNAKSDNLNFSNETLSKKLDEFKAIINNPSFGFYHLTDKTEFLTSTKELCAQIQNKKHFVQVGIGGSALGPQMLVAALRKNYDKTFTLLDNTDSDYLYDELQKINLKESIFYIVSKSGGTAETIACYIIVKNLLKEQGVTEEQMGDYFVFCTDEKNGQLRAHVDKHGYRSLIVPDDVGGRFSVLTHVGLLPALFFGINIDALYEGANNLKKDLLNDDTASNPLLQAAGHVNSLYEEGVNETVLMPYSSKLKDFSAWFVQLWAESLGKYSETQAKTVGLTPVPAYGATDQHSQMQLFMEGPNNKLMFMLNIEKRTHNFDLSTDLDLKSAMDLSSHDMNKLLEAEFQGSLKALAENKRNVIQITIDQLNESTMGGLILFFESLTAIMGEYLQINPFNQPGVEKGKIYAYEFLNTLK